MPPLRQICIDPRTGQKYIKKGRLHSKTALQKRALEWMSKWSVLIEPLDSVFKEFHLDDNAFRILKDVESASKHPLSVHGFEKETVMRGLRKYGMTQEQIENLEMEADFSTDEEDFELDDAELSPVELNVKFSDEDLKQFGYSSDSEECPERLLSGSPEYVPDYEPELDFDGEDIDSDSRLSRPKSRISLVLPYDNDDLDSSESDDDRVSRPPSRMSRSGYISYYEDGDDADIAVIAQLPNRTNTSQGIYGQIPGVPVGYVWKTRRQISRRSVHRPLHAGIHGGPSGAYSVVLSATYLVDDRGVGFNFYGEGGRDPKTKKVVQDQKMERGNLSLRENLQTGTPVRVIRGYQLDNKYSPVQGYRYDGLYEVTTFNPEHRIDGFKVFMFTFMRSAKQAPPPWQHTEELPPPLPRTRDHQHSSDSEDEMEIENVRRPRKKRKRAPLPNLSRSSTPLSVMSDDVPPPELQLPDESTCLIVYPTPPCLSPSLLLHPDFSDIHKRPVAMIDRLPDEVTSVCSKGPVNLKEIAPLLKAKYKEKLIMKRKIKKHKAKKFADKLNEKGNTQVAAVGTSEQWPISGIELVKLRRRTEAASTKQQTEQGPAADNKLKVKRKFKRKMKLGDKQQPVKPTHLKRGPFAGDKLVLKNKLKRKMKIQGKEHPLKRRPVGRPRLIVKHALKTKMAVYKPQSTKRRSVLDSKPEVKKKLKQKPEVDDKELPIKKTRGRPKKIQEGDSKEDIKNSTESPAQPVRRKRGRPKSRSPKDNSEMKAQRVQSRQLTKQMLDGNTKEDKGAPPTSLPYKGKKRGRKPGSVRKDKKTLQGRKERV